MSFCPQLGRSLSTFYTHSKFSPRAGLLVFIGLGFLPRAQLYCVCARMTYVAFSHREISHLPFPNVDHGFPIRTFLYSPSVNVQIDQADEFFLRFFLFLFFFESVSFCLVTNKKGRMPQCFYFEVFCDPVGVACVHI